MMLRFSVDSKIIRILRTAIVHENRAGMVESFFISHRVLARAASKRSEKKRNVSKIKAGRTDLACSYHDRIVKPRAATNDNVAVGIVARVRKNMEFEEGNVQMMSKANWHAVQETVVI